MRETLTDHLIVLAQRLKAADGTTPATIGKRALNDNTFYHRLAKGNGFTVGTYDKLVLWFSENWDERAEWPTSVARPRQKVAAE